MYRASWSEHLNRWLFPVLGPPPLGPYETDYKNHARVCPLCGEWLSLHPMVREREHVFLQCPVKNGAILAI